MPGVVVHAFNLSTWEAKASRFLSSSAAWSTKRVPGQPELHRETLSCGGWGEREDFQLKGPVNIFNKIIVENFLNLKKEMPMNI